MGDGRVGSVQVERIRGWWQQVTVAQLVECTVVDREVPGSRLCACAVQDDSLKWCWYIIFVGDTVACEPVLVSFFPALFRIVNGRTKPQRHTTTAGTMRQYKVVTSPLQFLLILLPRHTVPTKTTTRILVHGVRFTSPP